MAAETPPHNAAGAAGTSGQSPTVSGPAKPPDESEIASILFLDIVAFSQKPMEEQDRCKQRLQKIVRETPEFQSAGPVRRDTGDGMVLVFRSDFQAPIRCALSISRALKETPELKLRLGVHSGPIYRRPDINDELNVIGGGINLAQRVMDCGQAGHILVSQSYAEMLSQFREWRDQLHDIGEYPVKHGVKLHLFNFYTTDCGNPEKPRKRSAVPARSLAVAMAVVLLTGIGWGLRKAGVFPDTGGAKTAQPPGPRVSRAGRALNYHIIVQKYRNRRPYDPPFRLSREMVFENGWRLTFVFSSPEPGYLYVFNEGPDGLAVISPSSLDGGGALLKVNDSREEIVELLGRKGAEKLWIVWAKRAVAELEEKMRPWMNARYMGAIGDPVQSRQVREFLAQHADPETTVAEDKASQSSKIEGYGDVFAVGRTLEHW